MKKLFVLLFLVGMCVGASAQTADNVLRLAQRVNCYFMGKWKDPTKPTFVKKERSSNLWTRGVYYEGLVALYGIDGDGRYLNYIDTWARFHGWKPRNGVNVTNADDQCCCQTFMDRYFMSGDRAMMDSVKENLDRQMKTGRNDYWTWIDAIQMGMPVYAKMFQATKERKYIDYAMRMYTWTRDTCGNGLFNEKEGLWWRDASFVPPYKEFDGANCYWSRGNGWVYAALARVMSCLDKNDKYYGMLKHDFLIMSNAIAKCQRKDGFWNVSLMSPITYGGKETSGTSLFLYGLSWGVRNGLLSKDKFRPVCDKAYMGLSNDAIHENGFIGYLQGTGKQPSDSQPVTYTAVPDFEDYGAGCVLLGLSEYYKLIK
jgi:unsaturated rhamnogalacturonyl hydrolase